MNLFIIPAIMVISYLITEIFKLVFKKYKKILPIVAGSSGAIISIISYFISPNLLGEADLVTSIAIGIISGLSATGSNQLVKQLLKKEGE